MRVKISDRSNEFSSFLESEGRKNYVVKKYIHDTKYFLDYLGSSPLTEKTSAEYKEHLLSQYAPATVKSMLCCVNTYLEFLGVKYKFDHHEIRRSKEIHQDGMLTTTEYNRLLAAAKKLNNSRLYYIIETLCSAGLQVSELQNVTVEAVETGYAEVERNHKSLTVYLPVKLCSHLKEYSREKGISRGIIFLSRMGNPVDRSNVFRDIKKLCYSAQIDERKLYPENLRRLYKQTRAELERDMIDKMGLV